MLTADTRLEAQAEFERAIHSGWFARLMGSLSFKSNRMRQMNADTRSTHQRVERGIQTIAIDAIVGTLERGDEFDAAFRPRREWVRERWVSIAQAYCQGIPLPPIEVYQVCNEYYVLDGHHRVSVLRYFGQDYIEARVIEITSTCWQ